MCATFVAGGPHTVMCVSLWLHSVFGYTDLSYLCKSCTPYGRFGHWCSVAVGCALPPVRVVVLLFVSKTLHIRSGVYPATRCIVPGICWSVCIGVCSCTVVRPNLGE